jgi:transcriptional antiterminator RfaH
MSWYVLYTKPQAEKKVAEQLFKMGVEVYCPVITQVRQWSDRKKKIEAPLFTSYIFVNLEDKDRNLVFNAKGAVRYLFWLGKPAIVKDAEIEAIKHWLADDSADIQVVSLNQGDVVNIKEGLFKGQKGTVQQVNKNDVRLTIESMGVVLIVNKKVITE